MDITTQILNTIRDEFSLHENRGKVLLGESIYCHFETITNLKDSFYKERRIREFYGELKLMVDCQK